ncbi:alpha-E domain-containing protein [Curtobacterium pusillum]|uniref:Alpha-E domain-containing protein n=1 Tax=Curtobacterium pusillum TaxID=69373 RepID=A0AAW3T4D0_9MICO|nr:alpha-E domain-containing protein [Curtobacterium pusillum]MBA8989859.1 putative alpha-E superfamily protein [Curtobacterium pusillum]NUU14661.1 alpha-E domain-containing protein [Curtobacterium pusillum]
MSRLAGSVFHVGSAVERADVVARMVDVYIARREPAGDGQDRAVAAELRSVVGATGPASDPDRGATIDSLALDRHEPASIASAVAVARDNARRAREVVSTELWDCLNVTRSRMPRKVAPDRAHEFLGWVRERSALAIGVVEADASRDEVWEFFTLGRSLQRCATTARLLASDLLDRRSTASWVTALRACSAGEAFQRGRDHHTPSPEDAAAFLLLDERSPRSLRFLARRADECLTDVAPSCIEDEVRAFAEVRAALESVTETTALLAARAAGEQFAVAADRVVEALDARVFAASEPAR